MIVGIDIGEKGCIAIMRDGQIAEVFKMPLTEMAGRKTACKDSLVDILSAHEDTTVCLEQCSTHLQSQKTAASMWFGYRAILEAIKDTYNRAVIVPAKKWQGEFDFLNKKGYEELIGRELKKSESHTKPQSIAICEGLFPTLTLRFDGQKKTTKNDNIADAVLIAEYARRKQL